MVLDNILIKKQTKKKLVQDDNREKELIKLFELTPITGRMGIDAKLTIDNQIFQFEIKSTTQNTISTARDIDLSLITRWLPQHWIIGFYNPQQELEYCVHATPEHMEPWIKSVEKTLLQKLNLVNSLLNRIDDKLLFEIIGEKEYYNKNDIKEILCNVRCPKELLREDEKYSKNDIMKILKFHYEKMCNRGTTMNNPHIHSSYFDNLTKITYNHASYLKHLLKQKN